MLNSQKRKTMSEMQSPQNGLNEVQLALLRMFNRPMNEAEVEQVRDLLTDFYSEKLLAEVDKVVAEKGITEADYEKLRQTSQRSPQWIVLK